MGKMLSGSTRGYLVPALQPEAIYDDVAVQNTWNTVLATTKNVVIHSITWNMDTANEDLEIKITIDGNVETIVQPGATAGTNYQVMMDSSDPDGADLFSITTYAAEVYKSFLCTARSIKVEIRKTSANGANNLACKVIYAKW